MDRDKEKQEISLIGRLFSLEALLILMGIFCLVSGVTTGEATQVFWGVMIIGGAVVLHFVRKKDWKKHWEEQERLKALCEMREREKKEREHRDAENL
ncbi:hypothetical protein [Geotalea sp. SG265]|uniref:hypothetical protein n=1 Tax=Geotalea sp. SG265 TaxID=2922867 RepID=UPI001FAF77F1|nr:hypothetical protein [Geotalea sp. SG265]